MTDKFRTRKLLDEQFLILRIRQFPSRKALAFFPLRSRYESIPHPEIPQT